jgi:transcriptional regulator with XRE-family HTH domain
MGLRERFDAAIRRSGVKNLSELATLLGVSGPSISQVLAEQRPGTNLLPRIAERLGVHERWLRFGDDDVKPPWALSKDLADPLHALTATVRDTKQPKLLDVLQEILIEQRRMRVLLESCCAQQYQRAADGDGTATPSTRDRSMFHVPPRAPVPG